MQPRTVFLLLAITFATAGLVPAVAQEVVPDRRAVVASPKKSPTDASARDTLLDLLRQLEELQAEVRQLRNTVEVQGHELEQLKGRQRSLYDDLDKRVREAERRAVAPPAPVAPVATVGATSSARVITAPQQLEYDAAFGLMKQGLYEKAVKAFRAFLVKHPDSGLADNAQYWIGHSQYSLLNYKLALEEFNKVLNYPQSPKTPDAMIMIGYAHYELGAWDKTRKTLTEVQERYPGTPYAKKAAIRMDKMKKEGH